MTRSQSKPRYYVTTYDVATETFTPQPGVRTGPYSLWGLRKAIRKLRSMGYPCNYCSKNPHSSDPSVAIDRVDR